MSRVVVVALVLFSLSSLSAPDPASAQFSYEPPGSLVRGSGTGRVDSRVWAPGMRFPIQSGPAYANSQVYGVGGYMGPAGGQCDARNYSFPWRDNYCESRSWAMPLCPSSRGHQGQDIRPGTCRAGVHPAVAAANGTITQVGSYSVYLTGDDGTRYDYLHMSNVAVRQGQRVRCGDVIGNVSNVFNGTPTTIHLHFNIRQSVRGVGSVFVPTYMSLVDSYQRMSSGAGMCGGPPVDAGVDAGRDAGPRDAGLRDAGPRDAGPRDAGPRDAGPRDAGPRDSGIVRMDAGPPPPRMTCRSTVLGRDVANGECVQVGPERRECSGSGCGWYQCSMGGWICAEPDSCSVRHPSSACESTGMTCWSSALGRDVEHGECVQLGTSGCGMTRCGWTRCNDGAFVCSDVESCTDERFGNSLCSRDGGSSCALAGAICMNDTGCCGGLRCVAGSRQAPATCGIEQNACTSGAQCCRGLSCLATAFGSSSRECCVGWEGGYCRTDDDCCGEMTCAGERCLARRAGQSCATTWDCVGGLACMGGSCQ